MRVTQYLAKELFKGKTVFVTGGGSGINLGVAKNFAALGANVAICGRTQQKLDAAAVELSALGAKVCPAVALPDSRPSASRTVTSVPAGMRCAEAIAHTISRVTPMLCANLRVQCFVSIQSFLSQSFDSQSL